MARVRLTPWLRRGLEAAVVAGLVAIATLTGNRLSAGGGPYVLPDGPLGGLLLAPAVLALGVLTCAYPIAMAATRADAVLGAAAAFLIAADLTIVFASDRIILGSTEEQLAGGLLVALLALGPAAMGLLGGQLLTPLGFGRRAGAVAAILSAIVAVGVLGIVALAR
jgi:hypothetical protein